MIGFFILIRVDLLEGTLFYVNLPIVVNNLCFEIILDLHLNIRRIGNTFLKVSELWSGCAQYFSDYFPKRIISSWRHPSHASSLPRSA